MDAEARCVRRQTQAASPTRRTARTQIFVPEKKENGRKTSCWGSMGKLWPLGLITLLGQMARMFINAFYVSQQQKQNQKEQGYPLTLVDGNGNGCSHDRIQYGDSLKTELPCNPAFPLLSALSEGINHCLEGISADPCSLQH